MDQKSQANIQALINKAIDDKFVFGISITVSQNDASLNFSAGNLSSSDRFFIASTTKLFTSSVIFQLVDEGKIQLADTLKEFFTAENLANLHNLDDIEAAKQITIEQLLSHTSGLADYFLQKKDRQTLFDQITHEQDIGWNFDDVLERTKSIRSKFPPGQPGNAFYSDTNYQLLGKIIELIEGKPVADAFSARVFKKLKIKNTYLFQGSKDPLLKNMYFKDKILKIPLAMESFGPDGGAVSTSSDLNVFIKAFFNGELFNKDHIEKGQVFNKIFFPLEYGIGFMRFKLPRIFSPFKPFPELLGHSGHSGAFAFYSQEKDLAICGTVNQIAKPSLSFQLLAKIISSL